MPLFRNPSKEPLWKEEFSVLTSNERYVTRRQFTKFLTLASLGMFVGNLWILLKSRFAKVRQFSGVEIAQVGEIPVRGVKLFTYPTPQDHCIMVRTSEDEYVAYSQKCTHLSCAVYYSSRNDRLECPCHQGFFSTKDGSVLQGPPSSFASTKGRASHEKDQENWGIVHRCKTQEIKGLTRSPCTRRCRAAAEIMRQWATSSRMVAH